MVERLVAAVISRPSILTVSLNSMTRPSKRPFPTDFFSPLPRQWKGKEKAVEPLFVECNQCCRSVSNSSCTARHSPWCPIRNRPLGLDHVIPRRSHPHVQPCTRRHASSTAPGLSSQARLLDCPQAVHLRRKHEEPVDQLRSLLNARTPFDPEHAWHLYTESVQLDPVDPILTPGEQFQLIQRIFAALELWGDTAPDLPRLYTWGTRLEPILWSLKSNLEVGSQETIAITCFTALVHAWLGDTTRALQMARETEPGLGHSDRCTLLCVYRNILILLRHQRGPLHALDLLVQEWKSLGSIRNTPQATSLRSAIHSLLADVPNGAALLRSRSKVDQRDLSRSGELLLEAYCAKKLLHRAHALVVEMRRQNLSIDFRLQTDLTRLLTQHNLLLLAHEILAPMDPLTNPRLYYSTGLHHYAHRGDVDGAEQFFRIHEKNNWSLPVAQHMLMHAYAITGKPETVVELFHKFFPTTSEGDFLADEPEIFHYSAIILAYARLANSDKVNLWLGKMTKAGCLPDSHVYSTILHNFTKRGDMKAVAATLDQMRAAGVNPGHVHYTSVVTLLTRRKNAAAAEAIYLRALREGVTPDRIMITSLMNAYADTATWEGVVRVYDYLEQSSGFRHDLPIEVYNTLLKAYVLIGTPFHVVLSIFRKLARVGVRPDGYTYALVIQSACDAGMMSVAEKFFAEMEEKAKPWGPLRDLHAHVLTIIMAGHVRQRSKARAKACYEDMQRRGIKPTPIIYKLVLQAYANDRTEDGLKTAELFLRQIMDGDADDPSWTGSESRSSALGNVFSPLMLVYAWKEKPEDVERLFNEMLEAGGEPSLESLTIVMDAHRRTYNIDSVHQLWPQIWALALRHSSAKELFKGGNVASAATIRRRSNHLCMPLSVYIDALSAAGEHHAVLDAWTRTKAEGFSFDAHNWNHLAVVLVRAGELDRAFEVLERVLIPQSRKSPSIRQRVPESPIVFDMIPPDMDLPASDAPMHRNARRAKAVKTATKTVGSMLAMPEDSTDFAHPLHILHQVIPGLTMWRPHAVTLYVLSKVLGHLQRGYLVQPIRAPGAPPTVRQHGTNLQSQAEVAMATLQRIYHNYPDAVRAVLQYEREEARREAKQQPPRQWIKVKQQVVDTLADAETLSGCMSNAD